MRLSYNFFIVELMYFSTYLIEPLNMFENEKKKNLIYTNVGIFYCYTSFVNNVLKGAIVNHFLCINFIKNFIFSVKQYISLIFSFKQTKKKKKKIKKKTILKNY